MEAEYRTVGHYLTGPDYSGMIVSEVGVWLPGLVAAEAVGQSSVIIYDVVIFSLYLNIHFCIQISFPSPHLALLSCF